MRFPGFQSNEEYAEHARGRGLNDFEIGATIIMAKLEGMLNDQGLDFVLPLEAAAWREAKVSGRSFVDWLANASVFVEAPTQTPKEQSSTGSILLTAAILALRRLRHYRLKCRPNP